MSKEYFVKREAHVDKKNASVTQPASLNCSMKRRSRRHGTSTCSGCILLAKALCQLVCTSVVQHFNRVLEGTMPGLILNLRQMLVCSLCESLFFKLNNMYEVKQVHFPNGFIFNHSDLLLMLEK